MDAREIRPFDDHSLHGPVRKLQSGNLPSYEEDQTGVFKYPIAWPEPTMEWLVRPAQVVGLHLSSFRKYLTLGVIWLLLALARILCRLWFLHSEEKYNNKEERESEDEFKSFVKDVVKHLSFDDDFLTLALGFFHRARNGVEPSLEIPNTRVMELLSGQMNR